MLGESLSHLCIVSAIHFGLLQKKQKQLHIPCEVSWYFWDSWMVLHSQMPFSTRLASTANCTSTGCSSTLLSLGGCTCSQRKETVLSISLHVRESSSCRAVHAKCRTWLLLHHSEHQSLQPSHYCAPWRSCSCVYPHPCPTGMAADIAKDSSTPLTAG